MREIFAHSLGSFFFLGIFSTVIALGVEAGGETIREKRIADNYPVGGGDAGPAMSASETEDDHDDDEDGDAPLASLLHQHVTKTTNMADEHDSFLLGAKLFHPPGHPAEDLQNIAEETVVIDEEISRKTADSKSPSYSEAPKIKTGRSKWDIPIPDASVLKALIDHTQDYVDTSKMTDDSSDEPMNPSSPGSGPGPKISGPRKTCKRQRSGQRGVPDEVQVVLSYPHPLSAEDKEKMMAASAAYWTAVGIDPPTRTKNKDKNNGGEEKVKEEDVFYEKLVSVVTD